MICLHAHLSQIHLLVELRKPTAFEFPSVLALVLPVTVSSNCAYLPAAGFGFGPVSHSCVPASCRIFNFGDKLGETRRKALRRRFYILNLCHWSSLKPKEAYKVRSAPKTKPWGHLTFEAWAKPVQCRAGLKGAPGLSSSSASGISGSIGVMPWASWHVMA